MRTIFLFAALGIATTAFSQYYPGNQGNMPPPQYPSYDNSDGYYSNNGYGGQYGNDYDYYDDNFYNYAYNNFPQDYYYNYPTDYYPSSYYNSFYNDYRRSVVGINWKNFFIEFNLSPIQIQQITIINNRFGNYNSWYSYYGMNPNRWYYDRYYMLERIMGPQIFVIFQKRYYHGMSPIVYFNNYNINYYHKHYHCRPKYKHVVVKNYYVGRDRFFVDNPRYTGFRNGNNAQSFQSNKGNSGSLRNNIWALSTSQNTPGLRDKSGFSSDGNSGRGGFRDQGVSNGQPTIQAGGLRNGGFKSPESVQPQRGQNSGFRGGNEGLGSNSIPKAERPNGGFRNEASASGNPRTIERGNSGFRGGENHGGGFRSGGDRGGSSQSASGDNGRRGGFR